MRTWYLSLERPLIAGALIICVSLGAASQATAQEGIPPLPPQASRAPTQTEQNQAARSQDCPMIVDRPLSELTVEIYPRDPQGAIVQADNLPQDCWANSGREWGAIFVSGGSGCPWNCHELLRLARFRHPPLYFEDAALERYGEAAICPATRATAHFACDLLLLPAKMLLQRPCSCVLTPTPHCCSPYSCGGCH